MRYGYKHGMTGTPIHQLWLSMLQRCRDANHKDYPRYGGRGITVCERWLTFENFYADMGDRPEGLTLERRNNDGHYEPDNCEWATRSKQQRNRRSNVLLTYDGQTLCVAEWAVKTGIDRMTIHSRINRGWTTEQILTTSLRKNRYV